MQYFLQDVAVYLFAAVIAVTVAKRLGFSSVLGYLVAGSLLGPHVLNFVSQPQSVLHFAEFGVVIMLFLIGLELRPTRLWALRRAIVGMGGLQVVLSALLLSLLALAASVPPAEAVMIGLALALSSTAIVLQTLEEKGILTSSVGQNSFSVLLFQDIAVIPILAAVPILAAFSGNGGADAGAEGDLLAALPHHLQALIIIAVVVGVVVIARYLLKPIFRIIATTRQPELFTGFVLFIVVGVTLAMTAIGLSPALGAFLAGVVLADSEFRHEIEADLNPFKGLLMGLFFLSVGASIDYPLLTEQPLLVLSAAATVMLIKAAVLYGVGSMFGFSRSEKGLFCVALSQSGEFAFVIGAAALAAGLLSEPNAQMLNLVVAVTMIGTALFFMAFDYFTRGSKQQRAYDTPEQSRGVVIAGYGRFGQIIGRLMNSQNIPLTILDSSPGQVDLVRRFGNKVFYGDASRHKLLAQAGAATAQLLVVAVDDPNKSLAIIDTARKHFPNLGIVARAVDRNHAYELRARGIQAVRRETFHSALRLGEDALCALGYSDERAAEHARIFGHHDEQTFEELAHLWGDEKRYGKAINQNLDSLRRVLEEDRQRRDRKQ